MKKNCGTKKVETNFSKHSQSQAYKYFVLKF